MPLIHIFEYLESFVESESYKEEKGEKWETIEWDGNKPMTSDDNNILYTTLKADFYMPHFGELFIPNPNDNNINKSIMYKIPSLKIPNFHMKMTQTEIASPELKSMWEAMSSETRIYLSESMYLELKKDIIDVTENRIDGYLYIYRPYRICLQLPFEDEFEDEFDDEDH